MSSRALTLAYVGFGVLGVAVVGALVHERLHPAVAPPQAPRPPAVAGAAPNPGAALATVPTVRPVFALKDLDGRTRSITEWDGKALIVNFWATWCAPCRREIPLLNRIQLKYAPKGVEVVGIAVDFVDDVRAFSKDFRIGYPLLVGEQDGLDAAREFGVQTLAFPFTAFTDAHGDVLLVHLGELHEPQAEAILGVVTDVDAGTLTPAQGRTAIRTALAALPRAAAADTP